ncbi:glycoside hydrolase family 3 protein [Marinimicrobium agarilyticum]|uniref:glycoside hydrolase family 3 protein n=1 Tax=Marinimicrobium agarilyticum TaxID=306546 RepID=UPI00041C9DE8|nr:glycoside hydrolase family 3 N-terminal domain-containing protein [Marinimicrobium agarilyticum]
MFNASRQVTWPRLKSALEKDNAIEHRVEEWLGKMSLEQKVGQMIQPEIKQVTPEDIREYHLGSVLNGGGSVPNNDRYAQASDWVALADQFWNASMDESEGHLPIPIMWGTDAVHGVGNLVGATLFPHNIALGAAQNPELLRQIGEVTAREIAATGLDWDFSPTVAVARDDRWGRTYESWSEDPDLVRAYAGEMVKGLQGQGGECLDEHHVIATAKHFIGDGGTVNGIDRGDNVDSEATLRDIHGAGYFSAIEAGVQAVMASFNSWHGEPLHGHYHLLTTVLKEQLGFDGLVVGDWNGHAFIPGAEVLNCPQAINAGLDIFMVPHPEWKTLFHNTVDQAKDGTIPMSRIDDAVRRILRVKLRAGLFERKKPSSRALAGKQSELGAAEHRAVARRAVRESLVLLKNRNDLLPLNPKQRILLAGDGADNISKQVGGWSITWQGTGTSMEDFPGATTIRSAFESVVSDAGGELVVSPAGETDQPVDVAVVVFGEDPYAEMQGDVQNVQYKPRDTRDWELLKSLKAKGIPVVSLFVTGRPLWVNRELNASDAFMVIWQPGTEGAGVTDVLFTDAQGQVQHPVKGKLSFSWPSRPDQAPLNMGEAGYQPLFPFGYGLEYGQRDELADNLSEEGLQLPATEAVWELFKFRPLDAWQIEVEGGKNDRAVMSGNRIEVSTVVVDSVDREVQEDARHARWNGEGFGLVSLATRDRQVLTDYWRSKGALVVDIKVDAAPSAPVKWLVGCGPSAASEVDVTSELRDLEGEGWQTLVIALDRFPDVGSDFGLVLPPEEFFTRVLEPFTLTTEGTLDLTFSGIRIEKSRA